MIDEIPERDPLLNNFSNPQTPRLSLTRLIILLTLIFFVLLAMLIGSRALDTLASQWWPAPLETKNSTKKVEISLLKNNEAKDMGNSTEITNTKDIKDTRDPKEIKKNITNIQAQTEIQMLQPSTLQISSSTIREAQSHHREPQSHIATKPRKPQSPQSRTNNVSNSESLHLEGTNLETNVEMNSNLAADTINPSMNSDREIAAHFEAALNAAAEKTQEVKVQAVNTENPLNAQNSDTVNLQSIKQVKNAEKLRNIQTIQTKKIHKASSTPKSNSQKIVSSKKIQNKNTLKITKNKQYSEDEKDLLKHNPKYYTVQIMGIDHSINLKDLSSDPNLQGKLSYYCGNNQEKPWSILIYGNYSNEAQAQEALAALPEEIQRQNPRIQSFASLQGMLSARK